MTSAAFAPIWPTATSSGWPLCAASAQEYTYSYRTAPGYYGPPPEEVIIEAPRYYHPQQRSSIGAPIEDVAMSQGGLLECAVVGVPDEHSGEVVKLFAVKKSPDLTEADLRAYLKSKLTSYKMPKYIEFRQELPKTNVGKILRRALRDEAMQAPPAAA